MIQHVVVMRLTAEASAAEVQAIMAGLAALTDRIDGFLAFSHGPNRDFEAKTPDWPYGFVCTFANDHALKTYATDPEHRALGARLVALCEGGADGVLVYDLETADPA